MATYDVRDIARTFVREAWGKGNLTIARELLSPNLVNHKVWDGQPHGVEGFLDQIQKFHTAFPDRRFIPERLIVEGEKVSAFWDMIAIQKGEFFGVPPTGRLVTLSGADWYHIEGGKIVEVWHEQDVFGSLMELNGILP